jgi:hypothetical protein
LPSSQRIYTSGPATTIIIIIIATTTSTTFITFTWSRQRPLTGWVVFLNVVVVIIIYVNIIIAVIIIIAASIFIVVVVTAIVAIAPVVDSTVAANFLLAVRWRQHIWIDIVLRTC